MSKFEIDIPEGWEVADGPRREADDTCAAHPYHMVLPIRRVPGPVAVEMPRGFVEHLASSKGLNIFDIGALRDFARTALAAKQPACTCSKCEFTYRDGSVCGSRRGSNEHFKYLNHEWRGNVAGCSVHSEQPECICEPCPNGRAGHLHPRNCTGYRANCPVHGQPCTCDDRCGHVFDAAGARCQFSRAEHGSAVHEYVPNPDCAAHGKAAR